MTNTHQTTPEEEAYERLLDENWETLSEAARSIIKEAHSAAYVDRMVRNYCYSDEEYQEAMEKMSLAAGDLSNRECKLLMELVRRAIYASASLDPFDQGLERARSREEGVCQGIAHPTDAELVTRIRLPKSFDGVYHLAPITLRVVQPGEGGGYAPFSWAVLTRIRPVSRSSIRTFFWSFSLSR